MYGRFEKITACGTCIWFDWNPHHLGPGEGYGITEALNPFWTTNCPLEVLHLINFDFGYYPHMKPWSREKWVLALHMSSFLQDSRRHENTIEWFLFSMLGFQQHQLESGCVNSARVWPWGIALTDRVSTNRFLTWTWAKIILVCVIIRYVEYFKLK